MKIIIDKSGCLQLKRAGKMILQRCRHSPISVEGLVRFCGDSCPGFRDAYQGTYGGIRGGTVHTCMGTWEGELIDERE